MGSPDPPPPPDYKGAANEQGAANIETARIQGKMNNPNVNNPLGTQTVTWDGDQPTVNQAYSPEQQAIFDQSNQSKLALGRLNLQGSRALEGVVGKQVSFDGMPAAPGSYDDMRKRVIDAQMGRVNEDYGRATDQASSSLIAAGIRPGSVAYNDKIQLLQRGLNDAKQQAEGSATSQVQAAQNMDTQRRKDAIAEYLSQRQVPLNEITALTSGSQVSNPFAVPGYAQNTSIAPPPIFDAAQLQAQDSMDRYNARAASADATQSGLFGLGGSAMGAGALAFAASDRRAKRKIVRIGTHCSGIGVYRFRYNRRWSSAYRPGVHVGVMAADVLTVDPASVIPHPDGYLMVDYGRFNARFQEKE